MSMEQYFILVWVIVAIYAILGNVIYFSKVLPALDKSPSLTPLGQFKDIKDYLVLIEKKKEQPWFYPFLNKIKTITFSVFLLMTPIFLKIIME